MNSQIKYIAIAVIAVLAGILAGYLLFGGSSDNAPGNTEPMSAQGAAEQIWTCSMHPQIRQNEPGLCPICEMDLVPLDQSGSGDPLVLQMTPEAVKLAQVQTTVIGQKEGSEYVLTLNGKVREDERLAASQTTHLPGRIEQLFVTFTGEQVVKGQKVATIYSPDLITAQRELLEALKFQDVNPDIVLAARKKLAFWKIGDDVIAEIESSGQIRETFTLFADASGYVTKRHVSVGDYVRQGQVLLDLVSYHNVWVLFDAYEEDLARVRVGHQVTFTTPSLPGQTFKSRITYIDPAINPATRVASLRTEVSNRSGRLKPEMFVRGTITTSSNNASTLMVPKTAVLWTGPRSVVYVKLTDRDIPSYQFREVTLGDAVGAFYQVQAGLEPGDEVVTNGNFAIDAAAQLNNQQSMMNKRVSIKGTDNPSYPDYKSETPMEFKEQLEIVVQAYITLKDALVATDHEAATFAASQVKAGLDNTNMSLVKGDAHMYWMEQLNGMQSHTENIIQSTDIEEQRKQFSFLTGLLKNAIQSFGTAEKVYFVQFCPMAFDNEGADWISAEKQILNPYFGDKMLKCGKVTDSLMLTSAATSEGPNQSQIHHH